VVGAHPHGVRHGQQLHPHVAEPGVELDGPAVQPARLDPAGRGAHVEPAGQVAQEHVAGAGVHGHRPGQAAHVDVAGLGRDPHRERRRHLDRVLHRALDGERVGAPGAQLQPGRAGLLDQLRGLQAVLGQGVHVHQPVRAGHQPDVAAGVAHGQLPGRDGQRTAVLGGGPEALADQRGRPEPHHDQHERHRRDDQRPVRRGRRGRAHDALAR
jgi:hypothetical protein